MLHCLTDTPSPVSNWIMQLRDVNIQKDSARFRNNIRRISHVLAYEIGKQLNYKTADVKTPLGTAKCDVNADQIVIASILRAALPMHDGFLDIFDDAENAFLSAYRNYKDDGSFEIKAEYMACPDLNDKTLLLVDPMLATGASVVTAVNCLLRDGKPKKIFFASIISSRQGVETIQSAGWSRDAARIGELLARYETDRLRKTFRPKIFCAKWWRKTKGFSGTLSRPESTPSFTR